MAFRLRFSSDDDIHLLKEVLTLNPFKNFENWKLIHANVVAYTRKEFTIRAIKDHLEHLVKLYIKEDYKNLLRSGNEQQFEQKRQMLQDIMNLRKECGGIKRKLFTQKLSREKDTKKSPLTLQSYETYKWGETKSEIEQNPVEFEVVYPDEVKTNDHTYTDQSDEQSDGSRSEPVRHHKKRYSTHTALNCPYKKQAKQCIYQEKELALEEKRLQLEERRLALEEAKFEIEKKEREARLQQEAHERALHRTLLEAVLARYRD